MRGDEWIRDGDHIYRLLKRQLCTGLKSVWLLKRLKGGDEWTCDVDHISRLFKRQFFYCLQYVCLLKRFKGGHERICDVNHKIWLKKDWHFCTCIINH